jgi:hypothetical protein
VTTVKWVLALFLTLGWPLTANAASLFVSKPGMTCAADTSRVASPQLGDACLDSTTGAWFSGFGGAWVQTSLQSTGPTLLTGPLQVVRNGDRWALAGIVNSGSAIAVVATSASPTSPALKAEGTRYYAAHFQNLALLSPTSNGTALNVTSDYGYGAFIQQGADATNLVADVDNPGLYVVRNPHSLNGHDFIKPLTRLEDVTASTADMLDVIKQDVTLLRLLPDGNLRVNALRTTGAAAGKKVVCVDTRTGQLYASSTGTDCSN